MRRYGAGLIVISAVLLIVALTGQIISNPLSLSSNVTIGSLGVGTAASGTSGDIIATHVFASGGSNLNLDTSAAGGNLILSSGGAARYRVDSTDGMFKPNIDNNSDIGTTANRVRDLYLARSLGLGANANGQTGVLAFANFVFASITASLTNNGQIGFCSDCTIANPCASGGTGAIAKRLNGVNVCN